MTRSASAIWPALVLAAALLVQGCNSNDPTMGVATTEPAPLPAPLPAPAPAPASTPLPAPSATGPATALAPAIGAASASALAPARLNIAPIIGSTVNAVTPLSRRLSAIAPGNGVTLVADADPARTHVIKGYFSALAEAGSTTVVFVWDVFDPAGVRQHRIQGQEVVPGTAADPWSVVPPATMERIADRLIADYNAWRTGGAPASASL